MLHYMKETDHLLIIRVQWNVSEVAIRARVRNECDKIELLLSDHQPCLWRDEKEITLTDDKRQKVQIEQVRREKGHSAGAQDICNR